MEATFLDVNIEKKGIGSIQTSFHEKDTNIHQYIEFHHVTQCHVNMVFHLVKLNVLDVIPRTILILKKKRLNLIIILRHVIILSMSLMMLKKGYLH